MALQYILTIQDENKAAFLTQLLSNVDGIVFTPYPERKKMTGYEKAMDDIAHGRVSEYNSIDDMFSKLGIECTE